jgi:2-haloacid dehalogenase
MSTRTTVVFDLGGVLIDWNPRHLYRKLFAGDDGAMEHFLAKICTTEWNLQQDAGRTFADACTSLRSEHPSHAEMIDAWFARFDEMMAGPITGTVDVLAELRARDVPLYALSNWSAETFPFAQKRFEFLKWFRGILLSAEVRLVKPDLRIFQHFLQVFALDPAQVVYIDDLPRNIASADALGMHGILFTNSVELRNELVQLGLLEPAARIEHVAAWVHDLERARGFYERWFKAVSGPQYSSSTRPFQSRFLSLGVGPRLELMAAPAESPRPAHIAVSVGSREAVDSMIQAMESAGVRIVSRPRVTGDGYYEAVIADSEGNLVEVTG